MLSSPSALLVCVSPERKTVPLHLADSMLVGRADKCHLRYDDTPALSSVHCRLQLTDDGVVLDDCSTNGTYVNGERLPRGRRIRLVDGDRIGLLRPYTADGEPPLHAFILRLVLDDSVTTPPTISPPPPKACSCALLPSTRPTTAPRTGSPLSAPPRARLCRHSSEPSLGDACNRVESVESLAPVAQRIGVAQPNQHTRAAPGRFVAPVAEEAATSVVEGTHLGPIGLWAKVRKSMSDFEVTADSVDLQMLNLLRKRQKELSDAAAREVAMAMEASREREARKMAEMEVIKLREAREKDEAELDDVRKQLAEARARAARASSPHPSSWYEEATLVLDAEGGACDGGSSRSGVGSSTSSAMRELSLAERLGLPSASFP